VSRPLISASAADRPDGHRWQAGIRREVLDRILIVNQAARGSAPQPRSATSDDATGLVG